jgi:hypothetical protein
VRPSPDLQRPLRTAQDCGTKFLAALWLVYTFGFGLLIAFVALTAATLLFSDAQARDSRVTQSARLTDHHTTRFSQFRKTSDTRAQASGSAG